MPYDRVLKLMSPAEHPNLFVLGSFARRVTVYSQQVRAINLVDAIHFYRKPLRNVSIAVVGAGAAGLTAAARACEYGAEVTLFEQNADVLSIQVNSRHRWLHPMIYDWPMFDVGTHGDGARLPVMDWSARTADRLANFFHDAWQKLVADNPDRVHPRFHAKVNGLNQIPTGYRIDYAIQSDGQSRAHSENYQLVILAIGFGLEREGEGRNSYWEQDPADQIARFSKQTVLVGGYGDGALTDLMRVCMVGFEHETALAQVLRAVSDEQLKQIRAIESDPSADDSSYLTKQYRNLVLPNVAEVLKPRINRGRLVVLTGQGPHLFDSRACALNRLIVSQLLQLKAFKHVPLQRREKIANARNDDPTVANIRRQVAEEMGAAESLEFSYFILRFGPEPSLRQIKGIETAAEALADEWQTIMPTDDVTRIRYWERFKPIAHDLDNRCITFCAPGQSASESKLPDLVANAIGRLRTSKRTAVEAVGVSVEDCVCTIEALTHTVRALCRAPIAVFALGKGMGEQNPCGMLLLGIRAAVRRGLTLVIHEGHLEAADWGALPFNLKELQVLSLQLNADGSKRLEAAIADGQGILVLEPSGYRDLPVFDVVRRSSRRTPPLAEKKIEVFVLCPFSKNYSEETWERLRWLLEGVDKVAQGNVELKRVIDYSSPLLVGERLYELARFADRCIIDWTEWRANVFFELGVRLAVNPTLPMCVIDKSDAGGADDAAKSLMQLFKPWTYSFDAKDKKANDEFQAKFDAHLSPDRAISAGTNSVYVAAESNVPLEQEYGHTPFHEDVLRQVEAIVGVGVVDKGRLPLLYSGNRSLTQNVCIGILDALTAARYLLQRKIQWATSEVEKAAYVEALKSIESRVMGILELRPEQPFKKYAEDFRVTSDEHPQ
jgi:NAD(P)-binding Rossmann-like domain